MSENTVEELPRAEAGAERPLASIYAVGLDFLMPFLAPYARFVGSPAESDFILAMNCWERPERAARRLAVMRRAGKPLAWWTVEDPNNFDAFLSQARAADFVFTSDGACVEKYRARLKHARVHWLPLACAPEIHRPLPVADDATDFVISANWYVNQARMLSVETVVDPLIAAGYDLTLFCYEGWPMWPERYRRFWRGQTNYLTTAEQYRSGRVVLGVNNQRSGLDGHAVTHMTSMRTFEVLACGKPFLIARSDTFEQLGFVNGEHMAWAADPAETLDWAARLLGPEGERIARAGREFVLANHTYAHRLRRMTEIVVG
jgi:spore maturation protein CgeB